MSSEFREVVSASHEAGAGEQQPGSSVQTAPAAGGATRVSAGALLAAFDEPALLLDSEGVLHACNAPAAELLSARTVLAERNGRLVALDPASDHRLGMAVRRIGDEVRRFGTSPLELRGSVRLLDAQRPLDPLVLVVGALPWPASAAWWPTFLVVRVHDPRRIDEIDRDLLAGMFELTPAESRVAALLGEGLTPGQIAQKLGVALGTVRTQLKSIFSKTSTSRQADLVRLVSALPRSPARRDTVRDT
jgi:DNA-binding CsgD family transcriptional regulator